MLEQYRQMMIMNNIGLHAQRLTSRQWQPGRAGADGDLSLVEATSSRIKRVRDISRVQDAAPDHN